MSRTHVPRLFIVLLLAVIPVLGAAVDIDSAWLTAHGSAPYMLDQAGTTYVLKTNVVADRTAFVVLAGNVTFDLNGFTVTYGNSTPSPITNGGFEQGSARTVPGWNLTAAPTATLVPNTTFLYGNQVLRMASFSTPQTIVSDPIPISVPNHTYVASITPSGLLVDYGASVTLSVIDTVTNAVLATAVTDTQIQRGFSPVATFTPTTTNPVKLSITGKPPTGKSTTMDLDHAFVAVSGDYGILATPLWYGDLGPSYANLSSAVKAVWDSKRSGVVNFNVKNGSIVQGQGSGSTSSALFFGSIAGISVDHLTVSVTGINTNDLDGNHASGTVRITNSTIQDTGSDVPNRINYVAAIVANGTNLLIQGNTILACPQIGITCGDNQNPNGSLVIDSNVISQDAYVPNASGIGLVSVLNFQVTNNIIRPHSGQGIHLDGYFSAPSNNGIIRNNTVETHERPTRETGDSQKARALRVRNGVDAQGPERNIEIYNNTFTTTVGEPGMAQECNAVWVSEVNNGGAMNNANISLHDNHITAIKASSDPAVWAVALCFDEMDPGINLTFANNILESNDTSLTIGGYNDGNINDLTLLSNTFRKSTLGVALPYTAAKVGFDVTQIANVKIFNPILDQGATWTLKWNGTGIKALSTGWLLGVTVKDSSANPISGAAVTVTDKTNASVFTGTTAANGAFANIPVVTLIQRQTTTNSAQITSTALSPHTVAASKSGVSASASVTLTANQTVALTLGGTGNTPPVANAQSVTTAENTAKAITLVATDADGNALTYAIVAAPVHGTLTGSGASRTYTPVANYSGADSFTFKANDGVVDSNTATVSITVTAPVNHPPVANAQSVTTAEDTAKAITLVATDADGDALTYAIVASPTHGTLTGSGTSRTYTPAANYSGADSFTFKANDGAVDSNTATVSITVTAVNDAPVASAQSVTTAENTAKAITLVASDVDGNALTYTVVAAPLHGTLTGSGASQTYTPAANYAGADSFTFKANDGVVDSNTAAVSITVTASVNHAPVANVQSVTTAEDIAKAVTLVATDADGNAMTYTIVAAPAHGTLTGSGASHTYTPAANYSGADSFTFKANDGLVDSNTATVSITVTAVNDAPVASAQSVTTVENTAKAITLVATDADGNALTYTVVAAPAHGTLTGSGASQTYTPAANYTGADSFTFKANDGVVDSNTATVSIMVTALANQPPVVSAVTATSSPVTRKTVNLTATASDDGGEAALIYTWSATGPAAVTFSVNGTNAAKASVATFKKAGSYTLTVTARDVGGLTATKSVIVTVTHTLTSIVISPATATVALGSTQTFTSSAQDQFAETMTTQPAMTWTVSGGGAISTTGEFTAGATAGGPFTVTVASGSTSDTASVTVSTNGSGGGGGGTGGGGGGGSCGMGSGMGMLLVLMLQSFMVSRRRP